MRAAIIGVNGYIGQHLAYYLKQQQWEVTGYDLHSDSTLADLNYYQLDVTSRDEVEGVDITVDFIFYFSGITGTIRAYDDYEQYIDVNEKGLLHVLTAVKNHGSKARIVFPSTRLVYKGQEKTPLTESAVKEFKTIYSLNKWFGENILTQYSDHFNIPFTIFRICIPYASFLGKGYSYGTVGFFLNKAMKGEDISLYGNGEQRRSFTHVEDICQQIHLTLMQAQSLNEVFNIGGENFSLKEVAAAIATAYEVKLNFVPWPAADEKLETGDTIFESTKIEKLLQFTYKHTFKSWLKELGTSIKA
ncbi:MAG: NAD(P)-dependent oxidoreductase [Chitinophagaceae bacterium]|nr:NAD(P)-dependent oxidoreductase [Chitinophagaceae bacterium]